MRTLRGALCNREQRDGLLTHWSVFFSCNIPLLVRSLHTWKLPNWKASDVIHLLTGRESNRQPIPFFGLNLSLSTAAAHNFPGYITGPRGMKSEANWSCSHETGACPCWHNRSATDGRAIRKSTVKVARDIKKSWRKKGASGRWSAVRRWGAQDAGAVMRRLKNLHAVRVPPRTTDQTLMMTNVPRHI